MLTHSADFIQSIVEDSKVDHDHRYDGDSEATLEPSLEPKEKIKNPRLDLPTAQKFITTLTGSPDTPIRFRVISEAPSCTHGKVESRNGSIAALASEIDELNQKGMAVHYSAQVVDPKVANKAGVKAKDILATRTLFVDFDGKLPSGAEWHLQPSIVTQSINGKGHAYWVLNEPVVLDAETAKRLNKTLVKHYSDPVFKTDYNCCDIARVLRLPGSVHCKKDILTPVTLQSCTDQRYSVEEIVNGLEPFADGDDKATKAILLPSEIAKATKEPKAASSPKRKGTDTLSVPSGENNKDYAQMLADATWKQAATTEARNVALNNRAFTLAGRFPDMVDEIKAELTIAAKACGLPEAEAAQAIANGLRDGVKKPIGKPESGDLLKLTAMEASEILVTHVLMDVKYDTEAHQWYEYDNKGKWNAIQHERVFMMSQLYLAPTVKIPTPAYLDGAIRFAKSYVQVDGWSEMSSLLYLPFTNGVLDLKANVFLPHSKDYNFTWQLPRDYSATVAPFSDIARFLDDLSYGDKGLKDLAVAYCAAVLKGMSDLQRCLYLFGSGGNGKGVFINLLQMLVGQENVHSTNMTELNNNRFESANLKNKRLTVMSDEDKYSGKVNTFKAASGEDLVRFEQKGKDASTFLYTGMIVLGANRPTFLGNDDGGIARRIVSFPCKYVVPIEDRKDLKPLFNADMTAFTTYLLSLDEAWVRKTIKHADTISAVKELKQELAIRGNSVAAFYHAKVEAQEGAQWKCGGLFKEYQTYCQEAGIPAKGLNNFTPDLVEYCNTTQGLAIAKVKGRDYNYVLGIQHKPTERASVPYPPLG